jgi:hypothetical protein
MLDVAVAYNRYQFIGNEFLTWLWFIIDTDQAYLRKLDESFTTLYVGNRIVLENKVNDNSEIITIKGDDAGLEEGLLSLQKGAVVIEINLCYTSENQEWVFTLKGENLSFSGLKLPDTGPLESKDDVEGVVLEKAYLAEKAIQIVQTLYFAFLTIRCSNEWVDDVVPSIKGWIKAGPDTMKSNGKEG